MNRIAHVLLSILLVAMPLRSMAQQPGIAATPTAAATHDVEFRNGDVTLSGTLFVPANMMAAIVLVQGSLDKSRMTSFAQVLARNGVAALTFDKRGTGKSGGVYAGPEVGTNNTDSGNLNLLAGDVSAAVMELARRISSPQTPVGLLGISQAGWIIPLAAVSNPEVKFMILWNGPMVTTLEQLRFQFLTDDKADFWDHHGEAEVREHIRSDPDRYVFAATDPVESLRRLSIPGLWLYGGRDVSVPTRLSIERLEALAVSGKPFEYVTFPDSGHQLPFDQALSASMHWLMKTVIHAQRGAG